MLTFYRFRQRYQRGRIWPATVQHHCVRHSWRRWFDLVYEHQLIRPKSNPSIFVATKFHVSNLTLIESRSFQYQRYSLSNDSKGTAILYHHHSERLYSTQRNVNPMEHWNQKHIKYRTRFTNSKEIMHSYGFCFSGFSTIIQLANNDIAFSLQSSTSNRHAHEETNTLCFTKSKRSFCLRFAFRPPSRT